MFSVIQLGPESTPTSVPVPDITAPDRPDSPVPGPSNCGTVQRGNNYKTSILKVLGFLEMNYSNKY